MSTSGALRITAAIIAALSSSTALASPKEDLVRDWLEASSFGLDVRIGTSSFDPATQSVVLENVVIGDLDKSLIVIRYPSLTVEDPRRTPTGQFAAHALRLSNLEVRVKVDVKAWFPEFAAIEEKANAPKTDGSAPADPDGDVDVDASVETTPVFDLLFTAESGLMERPVFPFATPDFAAGATTLEKAVAIGRWYQTARFDWAEYNNLAYETTGLPEGDSKTTYGLQYMSGFHDGRAERMGYSAMAQTVSSPDNPLKSYKTESGYAVGIDLGAYLDVLDPKAYAGGKGDGRWRTVALQTGVNTVEVEFDGGKLTIGNIEGNGFRLRQTEKPVLGVLSELIADPSVVETDPIRFVGDLLPSVTRLYGIDFVSMTDLDVSMSETESFKLGQLDLNEADSDGIGALTLRNMEVKAGEAGSGSLNLMTLNNLKFGDLMAWIRLAAAADASGAEPDPKSVRDAMLEGSPTLDFFELAGLTVESPMGTVGLDSFAITESDYLKALARRYDLTFTRLNFPVSMVTDPTAKEQLTEMGYEQIAISAGATGSWDTDKGDVRLDDVTVKVADMGTLSGDLHIGNLPLSIFDDVTNLEPRLAEGTIVSGSITFGNQSIVERTFEAQAKKMNQKPEEFRKNFGDAMPLMLGFLEDKAIQEKFAGVLKDFFNDPKSIALSFKPAAPIPFSVMDTLQNDSPGSILNVLKVQVTANE